MRESLSSVEESDYIFLQHWFEDNRFYQIGSQAVLAAVESVGNKPSWARTHPPSEERASILRANLPHCLQLYAANAAKEIYYEAALAVDEKSFANRIKTLFFGTADPRRRRLQGECV